MFKSAVGLWMQSGALILFVLKRGCTSYFICILMGKNVNFETLFLTIVTLKTWFISIVRHITISKWVKTFWEPSACTSVWVGQKRSIRTAKSRVKLWAAGEVTPRGLVPFYNEHAIATLAQHRTSCDCRNQSEYIIVEKLQQQQIHFKLLASLPHICPFFSRYHFDRTEFQKIPAISMLACKYIVRYFFVRSSFLLHSTHVRCRCMSIVERLLLFQHSSLPFSCSTACRMLKYDLGFHPYKL